MKKLTGLFAAVALMGSGLALANEDKQHDKQQTQTQSGMTNTLAGNELTGRVVKSERKMLWVEHAGAIVPLKIDKNTQFSDPSMKRASDFKEGDEIRASFEVRKTDNVATSIGKNTGVGHGGSGSDVMMPDQGLDQGADQGVDQGFDRGINEPLDTLPPSSLPPDPDSNVNPGNKTTGDY